MILLLLINTAAIDGKNYRDPFKHHAEKIYKPHQTKYQPKPLPKLSLQGIICAHNGKKSRGALVSLDGSIEIVKQGDSVGPYIIESIAHNSLTVVIKHSRKTLTLNPG